MNLKYFGVRPSAVSPTGTSGDAAAVRGAEILTPYFHSRQKAAASASNTNGMINTNLLRITTIILLTCSIGLFCQAQPGFTKRERKLYVGSGQVDGKHIIAGVYIIPVNSSQLKLELNIPDDWVMKVRVTNFLSRCVTVKNT